MSLAAPARPGPTNSLADLDGLLIGCAEDAAARTGVTVVAAPGRAVCGVDVRGGGPGTRETDLLAPENLVDAVDAICLAGGSVYGLAAADGVVAALGAVGRGFEIASDVKTAPIVPGAILFDLANGGDKDWGDDPPYRRLGAAALAAAARAVPLGNAGAGFGALAGALKGGQGSASIMLGDGLTVAALACVNSFGSVVMPGTRAFWAWPSEIHGEFGGVRPPADYAPDPADWGLAKHPGAARENTTIAVVATNTALTPADCKRVAQMASAGLARAIRPVFAPFDGDVVFALSTGAFPLAQPKALAVTQIGALAADCLARAVARGVFAAQTLPPWKAVRDL
jgi:L-aminopeptidase/D-esterase-like protein